jgi:uncharacterized LabA/DUF88 family protein
MLVHAFRNAYDAALLFSGDADLIPVIEEVRRLGKLVIVGAFPDSTSPALRVAADAFLDISSEFEKALQKGLVSAFPSRTP